MAPNWMRELKKPCQELDSKGFAPGPVFFPHPNIFLDNKKFVYLTK